MKGPTRLIGAAAVAWCLSAGVAAAVGGITMVDGDVVIERGIERGGVEIVADLGAQLDASDIIRTSPYAVVFEARQARGSRAASSGVIARQAMRMRILIPNGVLGVRGTEFSVRVEK